MFDNLLMKYILYHITDLEKHGVVRLGVSVELLEVGRGLHRVGQQRVAAAAQGRDGGGGVAGRGRRRGHCVAGRAPDVGPCDVADRSMNGG